MQRLLHLLASVASEIYFEERFNGPDWQSRWVHSEWQGPNGPAGTFELGAGSWPADEDESRGLRTPENMRYHSISAKLPKSFSTRGKDLVLQFTVKHEKQDFTFCGGGYIKLLGDDIDQGTFGGHTPYKLMFGPDICGYDVGRIHTIFTYKEQHLLRHPDVTLEYDDKNAFTHLYTLLVRPNNTYQVFFDMQERAAGSLHNDWDFPNRTLDDPSDHKPADWEDDAKITDPRKRRPEDWVTESHIRDPAGVKPDEWDEEEDGEYEAPFIHNPEYNGEWHAPQVDNPEYRGEWRPRQLLNAEYFQDVHAIDDIGAIGFELWTVNAGSIFDNILLCDDLAYAMNVGVRLKRLQAKEKAKKRKWEKSQGVELANAADNDNEDDDDDHFAEEL